MRPVLRPVADDGQFSCDGVREAPPPGEHDPGRRLVCRFGLHQSPVYEIEHGALRALDLVSDHALANPQPHHEPLEALLLGRCLLMTFGR